MNQLTGKYVNVVLSVENGRGMEFVKHPVHVTANFCSRILESDRVSAEDLTSFNTELIWEVDKKELRKIRSSNQPLRVECISTDLQNRRDRIGFVLFSLRSAQIIPYKDAKNPVNFKWYKLIGCQADKKKHHPELYIALTVRDHLLNDHEENLPKDMPLISEEEQNLPMEEYEFSSNFPLKYLDDGFIQIGEDDDCESFSLNLLVKEVKNIDTLLPEALVFKLRSTMKKRKTFLLIGCHHVQTGFVPFVLISTGQNQEKYHMTFNIFGVTIKTKPFYKHIHESISLNEKVVVRILSNEQTLFDFFTNEGIGITLFNGHELLGTTYVNLSQVSFDEQMFRYFFKVPESHNSVPFGGDEMSPVIEIQTWVKRSSDLRYKIKTEEKLPPKMIMSNLERIPTPAAFGDQTNNCIIDKLQKVDLKSKSESSVTNGDNDKVPVTKSADGMMKNIPLSPKLVQKYDVMGTYVKYVMEVTLQNFVWKMAQKDKIVIFKFLHPRASNYITIFTQISNQAGECSDLKNIGVKITYVSTINQIENLLNAWPPKLVLTDEREKLISEEYEFDASKFFCDENRSYRYMADLKAVRTLQPLARAKVTLKLEDFEVYEQEEDTDFYLRPPIVDEILSVRELGDVEKWKKTQKETFENGLIQFKEEESQKLENMWKSKRKIMEEKLENQMNKCKSLQEDLQRKVDNIKTEKYLEKTRNKANIFEDIFKENWDKYSDADMKHIIEVLSKTQRDNEYLKKLVEDQRRRLLVLEKTTLTREQTTNLLQELKDLEKNFEEAQNAKQYFKNQWKKACDEIHELKAEEYKKIQLDLKRSREELSNLSLDSFSKYIANKFELEGDLTNRSMQSESNCH